MRDPATVLDIRAYLKSVENPDATLTFSGHSLAGALSPTLAFHLYPDPAGSGWAKVHSLPTAGATPGNAAFVEAWTKAYPATPADSGFNWNTDYANAHDVVPHAWNNLSKAVQPIDLLLQHHSFWGVMDFELGGGLRTLVEGAEQLSGGVYQNLLQQFFEPDWGTWDWKQNSDGSWQYPPQWVPLKAFTALHPMRTLAELGAMIQAPHVEQYPHFFSVIPGPRMPSSKPPSTEPAIDRGGGRGASGLGGEKGGADAHLGERALPLGVEVLVEHQVEVGRAGQPDAFTQLALQLAGAPAGVAQGQHGAGGRQVLVGQGLQDLAGGGQVQAFADRHG